MGGMFTILKVHPNLTSYDDPGWYSHPTKSVAARAAGNQLRDDGIAADGSTAPRPPRSARSASRLAPPPEKTPTVKGTQEYRCVMHPDVVSNKPGKCPQCGMKLVGVRSLEP
jgi:hypothetical protein